MLKLTTLKFNAQKNSYEHPKVDELTQEEFDLLEKNFPNVRTVTGFYKHILTKTDGTTIELETVIFDILHYMITVVDHEEVHILFSYELYGLMSHGLCKGTAPGNTMSIEDIVNDYYDQHPGVKVGIHTYPVPQVININIDKIVDGIVVSKSELEDVKQTVREILLLAIGDTNVNIHPAL